MGQPLPLFAEPETQIVPDPARGSPRVWVRRILILARPGEVVREIRFRRGLNVIWSPDDVGVVTLGSTGGAGHGAGKSLLCRLIRFCLCEDTFARRELQDRIRIALPEGLVCAEVDVDGETWGVVRSIGMGRRNQAFLNRTPEEIIASDEKLVAGFPAYTAALDAVVRVNLLSPYLPSGDPNAAWLFALAWMARDQECRFSHLLEWRSASAEAQSPLPKVAREQVTNGVRAIVASMDVEEAKKKSELETLATRKQAVERDITYLETYLRKRGPELIDRLELGDEFAEVDTLAAVVLRDEGAKRLAGVRDAAPVEEPSNELAKARLALEDEIRNRAVLNERHAQADGLRVLHVRQLPDLKGELANVDEAAILARLGPSCPICNVPIDKALAEGCGLSIVLPDVELREAERRTTAQKLDDCRKAAERYRLQVSELHQVLLAAEQRIDALRERIREADRRMGRERTAHRDLLVAASRVAMEAERLVATDVELQGARQQLSRIQSDESTLKQDITLLREKAKEAVDRLDVLFRYVARGILGSEADCGLKLTGAGIQAWLSAEGVAMESMKAVVFDLAAMLMAVEGRASLPALLVHDSPREADLAHSLYQKLLLLAVQLERVGPNPVFQYIVTTTTEPPDVLQQGPYVVATLSGAADDQRLLRRAL